MRLVLDIKCGITGTIRQRARARCIVFVLGIQDYRWDRGVDYAKPTMIHYTDGQWYSYR